MSTSLASAETISLQCQRNIEMLISALQKACTPVVCSPAMCKPKQLSPHINFIGSITLMNKSITTHHARQLLHLLGHFMLGSHPACCICLFSTCCVDSLVDATTALCVFPAHTVQLSPVCDSSTSPLSNECPSFLMMCGEARWTGADVGNHCVSFAE